MSGMRPTGQLHLGNYAGALENWVRLQDQYECYFMVADWHALTTGYEDTSGIRNNTRDMVLDWLSAGVDPERSVVFVQSEVKEHAELYLLLSMIAPLSWLERVPTYKDILRELSGRDIATHGFLGYPVLQAADIIVYRADGVPVGEDQVAHLELTRELVRRFNHLYGPVFPEPQPLLTQSPVLPGLDGRKMSKSYGNTLNFSDSEEDIRQKLKTMVTDPARVRRRDLGHPDVCPVYALHSIWGPDPQRTAEECRTAAIGCVDCKMVLAAELNRLLEPMRERRRMYADRPHLVDDILHEGARKAAVEARRTMEIVRDAVGIWA